MESNRYSKVKGAPTLNGASFSIPFDRMCAGLRLFFDVQDTRPDESKNERDVEALVDI